MLRHICDEHLLAYLRSKWERERERERERESTKVSRYTHAETQADFHFSTHKMKKKASPVPSSHYRSETRFPRWVDGLPIRSIFAEWLGPWCCCHPPCSWWCCGRCCCCCHRWWCWWWCWHCWHCQSPRPLPPGRCDLRSVSAWNSPGEVKQCTSIITARYAFTSSPNWNAQSITWMQRVKNNSPLTNCFRPTTLTAHTHISRTARRDKYWVMAWKMRKASDGLLLQGRV